MNRPEVSRRSTATPHTVPTSVGTMSTAVAPARDSTAAQPATPASDDRALPDRDPARLPFAVSAAMTAITAEHQHRQHQLVGRAERLDRPFLDRAGRQVDDGGPDGGAGVGLRAERRGQQLGHPECDGGRGDTGQRPGVARSAMSPSYPSPYPKGLPK